MGFGSSRQGCESWRVKISSSLVSGYFQSKKRMYNLIVKALRKIKFQIQLFVKYKHIRLIGRFISDFSLPAD